MVVFLGVICAALFLVPFLALLGLHRARFAKRRSYSWASLPQKINIVHCNGGDPQVFERLSEKIIKTLLERASPEFHHNLYKRVSSDRSVNERRGKKFELIVHKLLLKKQTENPNLVTIEREKWLSSDSRVDFFLRWKFPWGGEFIALIECKHSVKKESLPYRLEEGFSQLRRYKDRCPSANLLILVVDFQIPSFFHLPFTVTKDQEILLINYAALPLLFEAIANFMLDEVRAQEEDFVGAATPGFEEPPTCEEKETLDIDVWGDSLEEELPLGKRERKSAPYKALLDFFQEKLGGDTKVEFEIESEALRDKMGIDVNKYRSGGQFQPAHFKFNCLTPNLKKLAKNEKIKTELLEKKENGRKTLIFKVERLGGFVEETTPNKCERKSASYKGLLKFFQGKLGAASMVEFEIEIEELSREIGTREDKYRSGGSFRPADFKLHCLKPNLEKLEKGEKIKAKYWEKKENGRKTLIFKVERLEGYEEEKPTEEPPSEDWAATMEEEDDFLRLMEESTIQEKIWREERRKEEERIKKIIEENFSHEAIMRRLKKEPPTPLTLRFKEIY